MESDLGASGIEAAFIVILTIATVARMVSHNGDNPEIAEAGPNLQAHTHFIEAVKDMQSREDYPTLFEGLVSLLQELARDPNLTFAERRLIGELLVSLPLPGDKIADLVS